jgi:hypothetical protein
VSEAWRVGCSEGGGEILLREKDVVESGTTVAAFYRVRGGGR